MSQKQNESNIFQIITLISQAGDEDLCEIVKDIIRRYTELFPGWEVTFLSLPRNDPAERQRLLDASFAFLKKYAPK